MEDKYQIDMLNMQNIVDIVNATGYNASKDDELCPELKVYSNISGEPCNHLYLSRCEILDYIARHKKERLGGRTEIAYGICFDETFHTEDAIPEEVGCETRVKLLELYDKFQACGRYSAAGSHFISVADSVFGHPNYFESYNYGEESLSPLAGNTPYSEEAMALAYEKWQYEKRKDLGEPVVFHAGRCLFDAALFDAGICPGPFPGREFYMYGNQPVDPDMLHSWLQEREQSRQEESNRIPVGYCGQALCALRFCDVLRYFVIRWSVFGPETYRLLGRYDPGTITMIFARYH